MNQSARVTSIDALSAFRTALLKFEENVRDALDSLGLQAQRGADWVESDRAAYWPAQERRARDDLQAAQVALERCEMAIRPDDRRSCYDEKQAVLAARRRLRLCESKIKLIRKWARVVRQEALELSGDLGRLEHYVDQDLPRAVASLENMVQALARYAQAGPSSPPSQPPAGQTPAVEEPPDESL